MVMAPEGVEALVSVERGEIDRRIFSDPEIFEQELELIFARAWLFLCHESQIRAPGDFFEAPMGRDNVLVVRQRDGGIKALLNTCAHRGNAVCRAEEGNTKFFMCTYHGWTYDIAGNLVGVPGLEELYKGDLDPAEHGLREVAQCDSYKGFVFATMDASAPPLVEFLGETGRLGIDLIAARGDMEVIPGIQKFVIPCNWKFAVDNLFDWYHPQVTHLSSFQAGLMPAPPDPTAKRIDSRGVAAPDGTSIEMPGTAVGGDLIEYLVCLGTYGHAIAGATAEAFKGLNQEWRDTPEAREALGPVGTRVAGHPNIFPTSWIASTTQLSLRVPRGPMETEIWWFSFVDRNASPEMRQLAVYLANHIFGPAGYLEQEDGENWAQSTVQTTGVASRRIPQILRMGLGRGKVIRHGQGPPHIEGTTSEHAQLWTYACWAQWMTGCNWDDLQARTTPPEIF